MAVKSDGTLIIETGVDLQGFQADCKKLQQSAERAAKSIQAIEKNLESVMNQLVSSSAEAGSNADAAAQKSKNAQKEAQGAAKAAREAAKEADRAQKELEGSKNQKITITRMEEASQNDYDGPIQAPIEIDYENLRSKSELAMAAVEEAMQAASADTNEFLQELQTAQKVLDDMEDQGKWFGDEDYDRAYLNLEQMKQAAKDYKKELLSPEADANPFGLDTLAGKIRETELELAKLADAGKGLGNEDFDRTYRKLALLKSEAKEYAKELARTPEQSRKEEAQIAALNQKLEETRAKEVQAIMEADRLKAIGDNAQVSKKWIVDLNNELAELKNRQKELESAGAGLGYQEYDKNAKRIEKLNQKLKKYEDAVTGANKKTKKFSGLLNGAADRVSKLAGVISKIGSTLVKGAGNGAKAIAGLNNHAKNTQMSLGKMLGMSVLFSTVFRAIALITGGIGEGFQNLVQYSNETNASLSSLMSSLTRLKNSFATAFSPLLTVVSPILVTFINLIARALTYVGMFFAALTGKSSFVKAVGVQQDYGASLSSTADAANDAADATENMADATKDAEKANDSYLSGLDEVRRFETLDSKGTSGSGGNGGGSSPSGGIGGISPGDMFETVPIENSIKDLADKIKKLIKAEDWEGLGEFVADGINKGLQKVYGAISWKKVGPKITKFVNAFTETFNSLVDHLDFDLLGRTVGAGINDLVNTFNLLIGPGGIDFKLIGRKLSQGLRGAIGEIEWTNLGNLLGNYFMISWNIFNGFVTDMARKNGAGLTGWEELGNSLGKAVNGAFEEINFSQAGYTLTSGINGVFESLFEFARTVNWDEMANNVSSGMNTAFYNLNWEEAGKSLEVFLSGLVVFIVKCLRQTDWEELGHGIGVFLSQINWGKHLWDMITAVAEAISALFEGLDESGTAGKIASFLGKAFLAVKIAKITGIDSLIKKLVSMIGAKLITSESIVSVAEKLNSLLGRGTSGVGDALKGLGDAAEAASSGGFKSLLSAIGSSGAGIGLIAVLPVATKLIAGFVETLQGGNGKLSEMGGAINDLSGKLQNFGLLTSAQVDEIRKIVDSCEDAQMSSAEMADVVMEKFAEWGISTQNVNSVLQSNDYWTTKTKESVDLLAQSAQILGEGMSASAESINLSSVTVKEGLGGIRDSLYELSLSSDEFGGTYQGVLMSLDGTISSATTAQEAMDMVIGQLEAAGVPADEFIAKMQEEFPEAMQATKKSVETNIAGARQTFEKEAGSMKETAEADLESIESDAENYFGGVNDTTVTNWGDSAEEVKLNLRAMKLAASEQLSDMTETVRSYSQSMYNIFTKKWEYIARDVSQIISRMTSNIAGQMNSVINTVNYGISNINNSIAGIEAAMNFGPWEIPTATGSRIIGFHASFPRVPHVPYLASGAVIPPRSEFLAVLGDQKHGNNIEAPENLLRKIVREETGSGQSGSKVLHNVVQINRRTLFEEMIEEAKLRQTYSGKNPFELT